MGKRSARTGLVAVFCALSLCVACGGKDKGAGDKGKASGFGATDADELRVPRVDPKLCSVKGKTVQTFDLNQDNRPDVWKMFASIEKGGTKVNALTCKQIDYDHDGRKDYVATYHETGELIAEEFDFTFDGKFDAREHYDKKSGKVFLVERDTDHDKKPDLWEKYDKQGMLESIRRDRNADGKPDVWEQYEENTLVAILYDDDFDQRVDRKEKAAQDAPKRPTPAPEGGPGDEEPEFIEERGEGAADAKADDAKADDAKADDKK